MTLKPNFLSYNDSVSYWKQYQRFFPEEIRLNGSDLPEEEWWAWDGMQIHLDRMKVTDAKIKIIFVHGAGGNGRLLAPYARMLQQYGYEVVSPDLPPYGLSFFESPSLVDYQQWIDLLTALIAEETERDGKPVVLLGSSIGGMLAYHTAVNSKQVKGLIVTTFVDTSNPKVRDQVAPNKVVSRLGKYVMDAFPSVLDSVHIPVTRVSRMKLISNHTALTQLIIKDPHAAGTRVPLRLLRTFLNMKPKLEPEEFNCCPVLLVHPEVDPMTPFALSEPFFNRLKSRKECVLLEGAGHFPIEQPGLEQMKAAVLAFLKRLEQEE